MRLVESVPNFSEGRRLDVVERLANAVESVRGAFLLDRTMDASHNRSVLTIAGQAEPVTEALERAVAVAVHEIDMEVHWGEHPRIGSVDEVWESSELVLKVKEPIAQEYRRLREGLILFTYLHIAADAPLTRSLVDSGVTAVAYETVETPNRALANIRAPTRYIKPIEAANAANESGVI